MRRGRLGADFGCESVPGHAHDQSLVSQAKQFISVNQRRKIQVISVRGLDNGTSLTGVTRGNADGCFPFTRHVDGAAFSTTARSQFGVRKMASRHSGAKNRVLSVGGTGCAPRRTRIPTIVDRLCDTIPGGETQFGRLQSRPPRCCGDRSTWLGWAHRYHARATESDSI